MRTSNMVYSPRVVAVQGRGQEMFDEVPTKHKPPTPAIEIASDNQQYKICPVDSTPTRTAHEMRSDIQSIKSHDGALARLLPNRLCRGLARVKLLHPLCKAASTSNCNLPERVDSAPTAFVKSASAISDVSVAVSTKSSRRGSNFSNQELRRCVRFDDQDHPERQPQRSLRISKSKSISARDAAARAAAASVHERPSAALPVRTEQDNTDAAQPRQYVCHWHASYAHATFAEKRQCFDAREATMLLRNRHSVHRSTAATAMVTTTTTPLATPRVRLSADSSSTSLAGMGMGGSESMLAISNHSTGGSSGRTARRRHSAHASCGALGVSAMASSLSMGSNNNSNNASASSLEAQELPSVLRGVHISADDFVNARFQLPGR